MAVRLEAGIGSSAAAWLQMPMNYDLSKIKKGAGGIQVKRLKAVEVV